jgi:effector-binding domain-containing protein
MLRRIALANPVSLAGSVIGRAGGWAVGAGLLAWLGLWPLATDHARAATTYLAQADKPATSAPAPMQSGDPFGEPLQLEGKKIVYLKGTGNWDSAFDTLVDAFKSLRGYLAKAGLQEAGLPMTIYTSTDDRGFTFRAAIPVAELPKDPPQGDIGSGLSPAGKALKFTHRGPYEAMDTTYEAITNYLDERQLEAVDLFIEEYVTDPVTTPQDKLVVHVIVPLK